MPNPQYPMPNNRSIILFHTAQKFAFSLGAKSYLCELKTD